MKKYLKQLLVFLIIISAISAQVTEGIVEYKFGEHNALQINLIDVEKNLVEDVWKKHTKPLGKTDKKKGEFITKEVILDGLTNPVDWFMKLENKKKDVLLQLCTTSNEEFLSSVNQPNNYKILVTFLEDFSFQVEKVKVNEELEDEKNKLEKLQKKLKKLKKDYNNNLDSAKGHSKKIEKTEKENKSIIEKQSKVSGEIETQGLLIEKLLKDSGEESEEYIEEKKGLAKLQKKLDNLVKDF